MSEFDKKISALTSGTDSTATDEYVIARGGSNFKISGALVAAGATKVGTLASLAVTGNVSLGADVVLSRGAADRLDLASGDSLNIVSGTVKIAGTDVLGATTLGSGVTASSLTSVGTLASLAVTGDLTVDTSTLKVDAANNRVGIGTATPNSPLDVVGNISLGNRGSSGTSYVGKLREDGGFANAYGIGFVNSDANGAGYIQFYTTPVGGSGDTRMTIDGSGNVGIGVTPSAWYDPTNYRALQIGAGGILTGLSNATLQIRANNYLNASAQSIYSASAEASYYSQESGIHYWFTAPSGTAGNAISFGDAKMTLDASGNVGIGVTPTSRNNTRLQIVDGIGFPATQVASSDANTLDDYEEGTWTPTFANASNCSSITLTSSWYVKIGGLVTYALYGTITITSANTKASFTFTQAFAQAATGDPQGGSVMIEGPNPFPYAAGTVVDSSGANSNASVGIGASALDFDGASSFYISGTYKTT